MIWKQFVQYRNNSSLEFMEYKYQMLVPPISTESIDFKLSETFVDYAPLQSPLKSRDSLTYTVSMETIQDRNYSPIKPSLINGISSREGQRSADLGRQIRQAIKPCGVYNLEHPILSIKIEEVQEQQDGIYKQGSIIQIIQENNELLDINKKQKGFSKKTKMIENAEFQSLGQQNQSNNCKMGKVMSKIHSFLKENKTLLLSHQSSKKGKHFNAKMLTKRLQNNMKFTKEDEISENEPNVSHMQNINKSILTVSNSTNESPDLIRRPSQNINLYSKRKTNQNAIFLSERKDRIHSFKHTNKAQTLRRSKIYSTLVPPKVFENLSNIQSTKQIDSSKIRQKNKKSLLYPNEKNSILNRLSDSSLQQESFLNIIAVKMNISERKVKNKKERRSKGKIKSQYQGPGIGLGIGFGEKFTLRKQSNSELFRS